MGDERLDSAHEAILLAKQGRLPGPEMMARLVAGKLVVPTREPPVIRDGAITAWRPASASKADGSQWLIAFTQEELASAFCSQNPDQGFCLSADAAWVLGNIPGDWGVVLNLRSEAQLEWNAQGLARYKREVLGWED